ncbi:MAG: sugar phosphate nucleotidyltransferase [Candidatus Shapirobacteria bacterium]|jgi:UTP--glucose-1-phosphate uridylyltransferase
MSKITKAVLACGGWSTRFLPAVKTFAKQMVPILDKPQIHYILEELAGAGITDICIVHREGEDSLKKYFTPDLELEAYLQETGKVAAMASWHELVSKFNSIQFLPQTKDFPYGNGVPILVAKDFIGTDPFVYLFADDLHIEDTPGTFLSQMIATYEQYQPAAVAAVEEVPAPEIVRYGSVKYTPDPKYPHRASAIFEKLPASEAPSLFGVGGRFVLSAKYIETLQNTKTSKGELWLADANNYLAKNDVVLTQELPHGVWMTTGDPLRWLKANITMALKHPEFKDSLIEFMKKSL